MMNGFFYVFIVCLILLLVMIGLTAAFIGKKGKADNDDIYRDEKGRHVYYDKSIIEKEEFLKSHPDILPGDIRSFKRFFHKRKIDNKQ